MAPTQGLLVLHSLMQGKALKFFLYEPRRPKPSKFGLVLLSGLFKLQPWGQKCSLTGVTCYHTWAIVIGHHPFSLSILPSNHTFLLYGIWPNLNEMILVWSSLQVVRRSDKNETLIAIYDIATQYYRTIMSLLNIKFTQNLKAIYLWKTFIYIFVSEQNIFYLKHIHVYHNF